MRNESISDFGLQIADLKGMEKRTNARRSNPKSKIRNPQSKGPEPRTLNPEP